MDGFEKREQQEELARQREEASMQGQNYKVVADGGWAPATEVYGARAIVIAPVGGAGHTPEVDDILALTGKKADGRSELERPENFALTPADARLMVGDLSDYGNDATLAMAAVLKLDARLRQFLGKDPEPDRGPAGYRAPAGTFNKGDAAGLNSNHPGGPRG